MEITVEILKSDYRLVYDLIILELKAHGICVDEYYYIYLNSEYDLTPIMHSCFGVYGFDLTLDIIVQWVLATSLTTEFIRIFEMTQDTPHNRFIISNLIEETFFVREIELLNLINFIWQEDIVRYGYVTETNFNLYKKFKQK